MCTLKNSEGYPLPQVLQSQEENTESAVQANEQSFHLTGGSQEPSIHSPLSIFFQPVDLMPDMQIAPESRTEARVVSKRQQEKN